MTSLSEFLLARLADQAALACHVGELLPDGARDEVADSGYALSNEAVQLARLVLADVEAKRRIVERCGLVLESFSSQNGGPGRALWNDVNRRERSHAKATLADLAQPYAEHPDFDEAWAL